VFEFQRDFLKAYQSIIAQNKEVILCGGTGLYLEAALKGYKLLPTPTNEELREEVKDFSISALQKRLVGLRKVHNSTDFIEKDRLIRAIEIAEFERINAERREDFPVFDAQIFGIKYNRGEQKEKITRRLKIRLEEENMIGEVEGLLSDGVAPERLKYYGLEYKFITQYLLKEITKDEMFKLLNIAIHQFSKRQNTWFRRMERNGFLINWIPGNLSLAEKVSFIQQAVK